MMFGTLTTTEIVVRNGNSYEKKTFDNNGAISTQERLVTKQTYVKPIERTQANLDLLISLQDQCPE